MTQGANGPTRVSDGLGRTLDFTYPGAQLTRVTDDSGRAVGFAYTSGNLTAVIHTDGSRTQYEYATAGTRTTLLTRRTLPAGNAPLTQQYDSAGRVSRQTDSRGNSITYEYDQPAVRYTRITDPAGAQTLHRHTGLNLLIEATDPESSVTSLEYDFDLHRSGDRDRDGNVTGRVFDALGDVRLDATADGATTQLGYTKLTFNGFTYQRPETIAYPDGTTTRLAYDTRGTLTSLTDRAGQTWRFTYNQRGLPAGLATPAGGRAAAEYNPDGTPSSITLLTGEINSLRVRRAPAAGAGDSR